MIMVKLSVTIITKNEADNIRACLESVAWADEIIVSIPVAAMTL
jgi:glycosyltransferase involved in cell wall biosynthesis